MSCIIHLDNFQGQYYPGGALQGRVVCSFAKSEDIREIRLKLKGKEHTSWMGTQSYYDSQTKKTRTRRVQYTGDNTFLDLQTSLTGSGNIGPGFLEYPFSFPLPRDLPSSYNGKYGWIKYTIKATVDRPFAMDYEDVKEFSVLALIDFNTMINELDLEPVSYSDDKMICWCCCASGPITMNVHYEKEAYVPGEMARVKVEITNMSNVSIERLDVTMEMTVSSKTTSPKSDHKYDNELLASHHDSGVGAHGERTYEFGLEIPQSTVVPNFTRCALFNQRTMIEVTAVLPGCHKNMDVSSKVVLGNIPIRSQHNAVPYPYQSSQNNPFPAAGVPFSAPSSGDMPYLPTNYPSFPTLPAGGLPPMPPSNTAPYPDKSGASAISGPSAPPMEDAASAPPKPPLAQGEDFVVVATNNSSGADSSDNLPPPSYNEAVSARPYMKE